MKGFMKEGAYRETNDALKIAQLLSEGYKQVPVQTSEQESPEGEFSPVTTNLLEALKRESLPESPTDINVPIEDSRETKESVQAPNYSVYTKAELEELLGQLGLDYSDAKTNPEKVALLDAHYGK